MQAFEQLEKSWAEWNDLDPAGMVACSSGTSALHLAIEALQLPQGSQVIVPDFTMIACARAVTLAGMNPVFVDCEENLLMHKYFATTVQNFHNSSAIMAVHIYGRRCDMNWPTTCETHHKIKVIEDMAEAHGIKLHPSTDAACWSFYCNKIVHGEEGGAVYFRDSRHANLARKLRSLGFTDNHDFWHVPRGMNYRMSNVHAELILKSLSQADANIEKRRLIENWYDAACPDEWKMPKRDVVWVYDLRIPGLTSEKQNEIVKLLNANGYAARHAFKPCHLQPEYKNCKVIGGDVAERMNREVIYLPVNPKRMTLEMVKRPFELIKSVVGN